MQNPEKFALMIKLMAVVADPATPEAAKKSYADKVVSIANKYGFTSADVLKKFVDLCNDSGLI